MLPDFPNINCVWAGLLVEELVRNGVTEFVLSPGSRCTPLTVAVARNSSAESTVHFDERGAAFYALGIAKGSNKPVALICTSGTAAANYFPAIIEASQSRVPLIVLTADRPPELIDTGANQTIDQDRLYGKFVRWNCNVPCPDTKIAATYVLTTVDQAVYRATRAPFGPVHLNCAFREPLEPTSKGENFGPYLEPLQGWHDSARPYTAYSRPRAYDIDLNLDELRASIDRCDRGYIVAGMLSDIETCHVQLLAKQLQWPVLADIASGMRLDDLGCATIHYVDHLLATNWFRSLPAPQAILQFGAPLTSKRLIQYLASIDCSLRITVVNSPDRLDPSHTGGIRIDGPPGEVAFGLYRKDGKLNERSRWAQDLVDASAAVGLRTKAIVDAQPVANEPAIAARITGNASSRFALFLANSMPVRDADMFGTVTTKDLRTFVNRGASGIDGNIATAAGIARGLGGPVVAVVGDLALLHDLNSLALVAKSPFPVVIVAINNDGGGIFHFLPIASHDDVFEKYFGTPHGFRFEHAAKQFGIAYERATTMAQFNDAFSAVIAQNVSGFIEVQTDRTQNVELHRRILADLDQFNGSH
jgi:2-succinyl-5-enolpyruvyl-6-hydroxy-3-cyclohexene-1-carboxylate synthase